VQHSERLSTKTATAQSRSHSDLEHDRSGEGGTGFSGPSKPLHAYTHDPFNGFFAKHAGEEIIPAGSLLDTPNARRWFDLFQAGIEHDLYTYQLPLSRMAGPRSSALDADFIMFSSYSYLGLIGHPRLEKAVNDAVALYGTSTGGVRLLTGTLQLHHELEAELAEFLGVEAAAVFPSGYDANLAAISSLFSTHDVAILDQYAHQSIVEGVRLAGAEMRRFRHNDMEDLERRLRQAKNRGAERILIAVDSVFSMDGDETPLARVIELKKKYGAFLLVDEAHSVGAIGKTGRGICEHQNIDPAEIDILTGSLSKAIASSGGYVAGTQALKMYIQHGSAPYMFSAAITPANAAAIREALRIIQDEPEHLERLRENTVRLREGLKRIGVPTTPSTTPVIPVLLGDEWRAYTWARMLLERGIFVSAVVFPAVSPGQARLRLCATSAHREEHYAALFEGLEACLASEG
jgi:8-amino-7-oxononanoate synthase